MKSIGSFNSITATSLVCCDKSVIDQICSLTTKKIDEYTAEYLRDELLFLKKSIASDKVKAVCGIAESDTTGAETLGVFFRFINDVVESRMRSRADVEVVAEDESTNLFGDEDDGLGLFDDVLGDDLFGDLDIEDSLEDISEISIDDVIRIGSTAQ